MPVSSDLLDQFHKLEVFKLGHFILKSGAPSPVYIDLRGLISSPKLLMDTCDTMSELIMEKAVTYDYIVGVPYAALPMATLVSAKLQMPMLMKRKEAKSYGTKKLIEGSFESGKRALIIEDVVTSGASILETVEALKAEGLICEEVICALDREQGGSENLKKHGITLHSAVCMTEIITYLVQNNIIDEQRRAEIVQQLKSTINYGQNKTQEVKDSFNLSKRQSLLEENPLNKAVLKIILSKKTNLCVAIDETCKEKIVNMIKMIGETVCAIKLHADIVEGFDAEFAAQLAKLSEEYHFVLFADRKLADTGNTVELQLTSGNLHIADWANMVTVHSVPGKSIVKTVGNVVNSGKALRGALLIACLSSEGALTDAEYSKKTVAMAKEAKNVVGGFICQKRCSDDPAFLYWTPGVNESQKTDGRGQQWRSVADAIKRDGNDIIIVGRAITMAEDPSSVARDYAQRAFEIWQAGTA